MKKGQLIAVVGGVIAAGLAGFVLKRTTRKLTEELTPAQAYALKLGYPDPGPDPDPIEITNPPHFVVRVLDVHGERMKEDGKPIGDMPLPFIPSKDVGIKLATELVTSGICDAKAFPDVTPAGYGFAWMQEPTGRWTFIAAGKCGGSRIKKSKGES